MLNTNENTKMNKIQEKSQKIHLNTIVQFGFKLQKQTQLQTLNDRISNLKADQLQAKNLDAQSHTSQINLSDKNVRQNVSVNHENTQQKLKEQNKVQTLIRELETNQQQLQSLSLLNISNENRGVVIAPKKSASHVRSQSLTKYNQYQIQQQIVDRENIYTRKTERNDNILNQIKKRNQSKNMKSDRNRLPILNSNGNANAGNNSLIQIKDKQLLTNHQSLSTVHRTTKFDEFKASASLLYNYKQEIEQPLQSFRIDAYPINTPIKPISTKYQGVFGNLEGFTLISNNYQNIGSSSFIEESPNKSRNHAFNFQQSVSGFKLIGQSPLQQKSVNMMTSLSKIKNVIEAENSNPYEQQVNSHKAPSKIHRKKNQSFEVIPHKNIEKCQLPKLDQSNCQKIRLKRRMIKFSNELNSSEDRQRPLPNIKIVNYKNLKQQNAESRQTINNYISTATDTQEDMNSSFYDLDQNITLNTSNQADQYLLKDADKFFDKSIVEQIYRKDSLAITEEHSISLSPDNRNQRHPQISAFIIKKNKQ
ncbi:UNKNOWN [Stylonychia lemnae]|uniref:Uncharacterized protein n=1 Tax=Stylonychia lemnae TaxID=5949 RepID=A0A078B0A4_STYLE|nr:UNKNOWN [Stylonychia lemnae]|eukprot:CDW87929.1 UNKNOWN [Stylonychia lemnae]